MLFPSLLIALLCTLGVKSQPSYSCLPASAVLPTDHVCRDIYTNDTIIMVPNPEQTHFFRRNAPTDLKDIQTAVNESCKEIQRQIVAFSSPDYCSNKILTLLCFFFFPICGYGENGLAPPVFPCLSLCKEVTAPESNCSRRVNNYWGPIYKGCNYTYYSGGDSSNPNGGFRQVYKESSYCANGTHALLTTAPPITTCACCTDLDSKFPEDVEDPTVRCRSKKTRIFNVVSSKQLERLKSTYVLNCTITSLALDGNGICGKKAIKCRVNQFYGLKNDTCEQAGLTAGMEVYVLGYPIICKKTSIFQTFEEASIGDTIFIAGKHIIKCCGQTYLYLVHRDIVAKQLHSLTSNSKQCKLLL